MYYHMLREKYNQGNEFITDDIFEQKESEFVDKYEMNYKAAQIYIYALNDKSRDTVMYELHMNSKEIQRHAKEAMNKVI